MLPSDSLLRVFERAKVPINVTVRYLDLFYNKIEDEERDTDILSICLFSDK